MQITVAGKQLDLSETLRERVQRHLNQIADKYFDHAIEANVTFSKARSFFTCDINVHAGRGLLMRGEGEASDAHGAFDDAAEHIAKRLRRYRRRVSDHARDLARERRPEIGRQYVLQQDEPGPSPDAAGATTGLNGSSGPFATVIAEMPAEIATLSVSEAVMRMDLTAQSVLMFRNSSSTEINVVYRRGDGHIGWIDPGATLN